MAQGMQNTLRNMDKTYGKYAGNGTKMNENRCPEASKEQVGGRTQCAKQRLKYLQNVPKIIENRGLEGSKIKGNRDLEGGRAVKPIASFPETFRPEGFKA